jgi:hypothetical protein
VTESVARRILALVRWLLLLLVAKPEAIKFTIAGQPVAMLRFAESGLTVSASCRKGGRLTCQALSALVDASRRSAESARHGAGGVDCPDFQATRVDPADGQPVCKFGDGSLIRREDLEHFAQAKDDWELALADPITAQLPKLATCLEHARLTAIGTLHIGTSFDDRGHPLKPHVEPPGTTRAREWPAAEKCVLAAFNAIHFEKPPEFVAPQVELDLDVGERPRVEHVSVRWTLRK